MSGVPIFPSGIVKQYISPIPFGDNVDLTKFTFDQQKGSTKLRTEKHKNILLSRIRRHECVAMLSNTLVFADELFL